MATLGYQSMTPLNELDYGAAGIERGGPATVLTHFVLQVMEVVFNNDDYT
ncbi:MAG: hypothetical protein F6K42_33990 [Leptolyngbya sp. SIO1D8]|nr:hypothetical protein [Leptolyngbya sp. SIO1D8]